MRILMYHSISAARPDPHLVCVSPARFAEQIEWLRRHRYHGVSMRELLRARAAGSAKKLVGLTFDDGYTDFRTHALPVLRDAGFTATVYVVAGRFGGTNDWDAAPRLPLMERADVAAVAAEGIEIGSHTLSHRRLSTLDLATARDELVRSRAALEAIDGVRVEGIAYPYGDATPWIADLAQLAGYRYACATKPGDPANRWMLGRRYVGERDGGLRLRAKLMAEAA
jgi:peptidoglycan/xylan/chitin deacetylase (PgdA/CDA1 family)